MTYLVDTNIITEILKGNEVVEKKAVRKILEGNRVLINGISYYEIKRGLLASNAANKLKKFEMLWKTFGLLLLDNKDIFDRASQIYAGLKKNGKLISDADILIASMAFCQNCILVSNDTDFERIEDLKLENWITNCEKN